MFLQAIQAEYKDNDEMEYNVNTLFTWKIIALLTFVYFGLSFEVLKCNSTSPQNPSRIDMWTPPQNSHLYTSGLG